MCVEGFVFVRSRFASANWKNQTRTHQGANLKSRGKWWGSPVEQRIRVEEPWR